MEKKKRNEIVARLTTLRNGEKREFVTTAVSVGDTLTFNKIGDAQTFNGVQWDPVEDSEGHRMSLNKIVFGKNIKFNSNRIEDRIDAVIAAIESDKGLKLKVTKIEERQVLDDKRQPVTNADGTPAMSKVYSWNKELVG